MALPLRIRAIILRTYLKRLHGMVIGLALNGSGEINATLTERQYVPLYTEKYKPSCLASISRRSQAHQGSVLQYTGSSHHEANAPRIDAESYRALPTRWWLNTIVVQIDYVDSKSPVVRGVGRLRV